MKALLALALGTIVLAQPSFARGGSGGGGGGNGGGGNGGGGNNDVIARDSQAWFASEGAEHLIEGLVSAGTITEAGLTAMTLDLSANTLQVALTSNIGQVTGQCQMVDEWSRGGTVLKKDVRCVGVAETRTDLARGSDAWAVVEGLEHSMRLAIGADASVLTQVTSATSELQGTTAVLVSLGLANGTTQNFTCTRRNALSLNCIRN